MSKRSTAPTAAELEPRPRVHYTEEGGGVVATCSACGWLAWKPTKVDAMIAAKDHKRCLKDDVALVRRLSRRKKAQRIYEL